MSAPVRHFARHYAEMVIAMLLGMVVLGIPVEGVLRSLGSDWSRLTDQAPAAMLALMAMTMTVPMAAWMRFRGHRWQPTLEMSAAMVIPTLAVILMLGTGAVTDIGVLFGFEHVAMFGGMLAAMLLRLDEYTGHHTHAAAVRS
jgi:hypothetical protein